MALKDIQQELRQFAKDRDWDQFHSPKNLSMALAGEAGELLEIFQWLTEEQSARASLSEVQIAATAEEIADIMIYSLRLADRLEIDVEIAIKEKIKSNAKRYSVEVAKGNAAKR